MAKRRKQDNEYMKKLAEMACIFCGIEPCGEPHHVRIGSNGGTGLKPTDNFVIPTCHKCHTEIHTKGELSFYKKHGYTVDEIHQEASSHWED